jgi:hypothetical protein
MSFKTIAAKLWAEIKPEVLTLIGDSAGVVQAVEQQVNPIIEKGLADLETKLTSSVSPAVGAAITGVIQSANKYADTEISALEAKLNAKIESLKPASVVSAQSTGGNV